MDSVGNRLATAAVALAAGIPLLAAIVDGRWLLAILAVVFGGGWLIDRRRGRGRWAGFCMSGMVAVLVIGFLGGMAAPLVLIGLLVAYVAWDLDRFARRMAAGEVVDQTGLLRSHLIWLGQVGMVAALLSGFALAVRGNLDFWLLVPLALAVFVALGRVVVVLRRIGAEEG